jgi:hypothetical protein
MANHALVLFAPWFAILTWAYWKFPKSHRVSASRRRFDVIAIVIALALSGLAMRWAYAFDWRDAGQLWPQVVATLSAYKVFLITMMAAFWLRTKRFTGKG